MTIRHLKAVVFDFDGVILDTESTLFEAWQRTYAAHGCTLPLDLWAANVGGYSYDVFDPLAHLETQYGRPIDREAVTEARRAAYLQQVHAQEAIPGVREALVTVKEHGLKLAVASSSSRNWVHGHLRRLGLYHYFDAFACGDEVNAVKPDPELYLCILDRLGVTAQDAFVVEDSPKGIAAARAAALYCVAVPNPVTQAAQLTGYHRLLAGLCEQPFSGLLAEIEAAFAQERQRGGM